MWCAEALAGAWLRVRSRWRKDPRTEIEDVWHRLDDRRRAARESMQQKKQKAVMTLAGTDRHTQRLRLHEYKGAFAQVQHIEAAQQNVAQQLQAMESAETNVDLVRCVAAAASQLNMVNRRLKPEDVDRVHDAAMDALDDQREVSGVFTDRAEEQLAEAGLADELEALEREQPEGQQSAAAQPAANEARPPPAAVPTFPEPPRDELPPPTASATRSLLAAAAAERS